MHKKPAEQEKPKVSGASTGETLQWTNLLCECLIQNLYRPFCAHFALPDKQVPGLPAELFCQNHAASPCINPYFTGTPLEMSATYIARVVMNTVRRRKVR